MSRRVVSARQKKRKSSNSQAQPRKSDNAAAVSGSGLRETWVAPLGLLLATLIAYQQVWFCGYIWDDNFYVTQNTTLRSLRGLWQIWVNPTATPQYYPLVHTSFWLEYQLWGLN